MPKGWFRIHGVQDGTVTLDEQMQGLELALSECSGKTVVDFGCAEGLISQEFALAGAKSVFGIDRNAELIAYAKTLERHNLHFQHAEIPVVMKQEVESGEMCPYGDKCGQPWQYDIVLALAVLHKMPDPFSVAVFMAQCTRSLMVVRLRGGSEGIVKYKHGALQCDIREVLPTCGLRLERITQGPRDERVMYWRR